MDENHFTQESLAIAAGMSDTTVCRALGNNGDRQTIREETASAIAKVFHLNKEDINWRGTVTNSYHGRPPGTHCRPARAPRAVVSVCPDCRYTIPCFC
jgi:DNA-binding XRE family transcriptional regulator